MSKSYAVYDQFLPLFNVQRCQMSTQIKVYETVTQQPNGDRDVLRHPSSAFEVYLVKDNKRFRVFKNNQFDRFHCHISGTRLEYLNEAMKHAEELALVLDGCEIVGVDLTKDEKRMMELEAEISRLTSELNLLKRKTQL